MTTSGVYTWEPTVACLIDEAAERAGISPSSLSSRHLVSARNSLNFAFRELETRGLREFFAKEQETTTVSSGTGYIALPSGTIEVLDVWYTPEDDDNDSPLTRITRQDYNNIPNKDASNDPTNFYIDFDALNQPVMRFWPVPDAEITLYYDRLRYIQDVTTLSGTVDLPRLWYDTLAYSLARRLAEKFNEQRVGLMASRFNETLAATRSAVVPRGDIMIYGAQRRRRRA